MSRLEGVENEVKQLTAEELRAFRHWFAEFDARHGTGSLNRISVRESWTTLRSGLFTSKKRAKPPTCDSQGDAGFLGLLWLPPETNQDFGGQSHYERLLD